MSPVHLRNLGDPSSHPEDREGLSRTRLPGRGHLGHSGLEGYGSRSSAPPTPQRHFSMENGQKEVQPRIPLGRIWSKFPEDMSQRDRLQRPYGYHQSLESHQAVQTSGREGNQDKGESSQYPSYRRTADPDRAYSDSFRLTRSRQNKLSSSFTPFRNQQISGQESPFFKIPERVRPNDPEDVGLGERSTQEPEIAVHTSRISGPINRNITPTQTEHNVVTPESNLNCDKLWLQMSQFAVQTKESLDDFKRMNERLQRKAILQEATIKSIQEICAQFSKASEETNKRLNQVFEEAHHCKRDRDFLDQDINKLFNFYQNMKRQPECHALENPYHQEDIKPDDLLVNKARSSSQYKEGDNMSYSEKEALKQLPMASSWPKLSEKGEYNHMELIDYIDRLFIDLKSIPDCWITARLNTSFRGHASIWYTEMKEIHGRRSCPWWKRQIIQKYSNGTWIWQTTMSFENDKYSVDKDPYEWCLRQSKSLKAIDPQMNMQMRNHKMLTQIPGELEHAVKCRCNQNCTLDEIANTLKNVRKRTNIGKYSPYKSSGFKEKQPFRVEFKDKPRERVAGVAKKKNSCHNCGSTDHYSNNCPKANKKVYAIAKVPEEKSSTKDSESDSMGDAIREQRDNDQDPREELLVEYQEETTLEIKDIQLESGMPQDTENKNLCKHTQDAQTFLVTPTEGMEYIHGTATKITVFIDNSQHQLIIESGAHCSIVARDYLDHHFPN
ncbi:hypothetical protein O181_016186 [Austropuccinia psidii MF-1]|uniref:CCHC-type domain-containing protein n=1 Tax=Austropuccinia psidii MF-1 TaxID=1389203 RepID=A0A9Q3GQT1_9BASI|nr:hypothetical protein [Austropuccinia psidii MF-1]